MTTVTVKPTSDASPPLCGFILIDKQPGMTSHFVVSRVKKILKTDKVGHLGTLDPFASGLLPIMIGGATRLADEVMEGKKGYLFELCLGTETDTLDPVGSVVKQQAVPDDFAIRLANILPTFTGEISQVPPAYSALKMNGMPLYEHMRGTGALPFDIETKRRSVLIYQLELVRCESRADTHTATLRVQCSKGTYIRSLARDLAAAIGTVGYCSQLRREMVEPWEASAALVFNRDAQPRAEELLERLQPPEKMVASHIPCVAVRDVYRKPMSAGNSFVMSAEEWMQDTHLTLSDLKLVLLRCEDLLYLTEVVPSATDKTVKVQPRKKIR